jgi:hypothetical protein
MRSGVSLLTKGLQRRSSLLRSTGNASAPIFRQLSVSSSLIIIAVDAALSPNPQNDYLGQPMPDSLTPQYWRNRAKEVRTPAEQMTDPRVREMLLRSAQDYETLAKQIEEKQRPR